MTRLRGRYLSNAGRQGLPTLLVLAAVLLGGGSIRAQDAPAEVVPSAVGDAVRDLVFTPVPRCRVIDTRVEGGRLVGGVPRNVDVAGALAGQGGAADCLVPYGPATVVVLNLVAVQPLGRGTVTAWPFGGARPAANVISYNGRRALAGANAANEVTLAICNPAAAECTYDLTLEANGADTHVVADVAGYFSAVTGLTVPWTAVTGKPPGFDDDTDDDTQYSAGAGLSRSGTVFSVDTAAIQSRVLGTCAVGAAIRAIQPNGQVLCETDDDTNTAYTAGNGLLLSGTTFLVNPSIVQGRVSQTCAVGSSIRAIDVAGAVTCETDTDTSYTAGNGIAIGSGSISVANAAIGSAMLAPAAVTAGKIAANAVTFAEIADRSIVTADIAEGAVTGTELASFAVGLNKIAAGAVRATEIATDAVGSSEIATGAVGRSEIDGTERAIYRMRAACHADAITTSATCTTPLCTPVPIPLFWSCGNNCDSFVPLECDNTLLGYLLSPSIG